PTRAVAERDRDATAPGRPVPARDHCEIELAVAVEIRRDDVRRTNTHRHRYRWRPVEEVVGGRLTRPEPHDCCRNHQDCTEFAPHLSTRSLDGTNPGRKPWA